eukprot:jgi/Mesvir1/28997/Mv17766-RA.1
MNDQVVEKQINQMVQFIRQEAEEKANEINIAAEEEFQIEKLQMVEAEKQKVKREYERKEQQAEVKKKIEYSMQLNQARIKVLQAREDGIRKIKADAMHKLAQIAVPTNPAYKTLLVDLIVQALHSIGLSEVSVRVRECDVGLARTVLDEAVNTFASKYGKAKPVAVLDTQHFLPPPPTPGYDGPTCDGGIMLLSKDGRITCMNTLEERLEIAFQALLPEIRTMVFTTKQFGA